MILRGDLELADPVDARLLGPASARWRRLWHLALATAALQLVFWYAVRPVLFNPPRLPPLYAVSDAQQAVLSGPGTEALERARFEPAELPWTDCCAPGYRALRFNVDIPQVPEHGIALIPNADADNLQVRINGQIVDARGRMTLPRPTFEVNVKRVVHVAPAVFHPGKNQVDYIMARQVLPYFDVTRPLFADYAVAWPMFRFREFILTDYELIGAALAAVIALFAVVLLRRSTQRGLSIWLAVLAASWSLLTQFYFWVDPPFSADLRMLYYFALTNLLPVAWLNFSDQWTRRPFRWIAPMSLLGYAACMATTYWALNNMDAPDGFDRASDVANWFGLALSESPAKAITRPSPKLWDTSSGFVIRSVPLLLLAFLAAFLARNIRLFQSTHEINQLLRVRLEAREAELAETHRRESDLVRREAHQAERQRLMRDMHDGVGSQLTSMLFAARRGPMPPDTLADALQTVIDEIRLLIDSMDATSDSLAGALAAFERRAAQRLEAAGIVLECRSPPNGSMPVYGPRAVLHVMRILQEALSNALRHGHCGRIELHVETTGDASFPVVMVVRDDGQGFAHQAQAGRGLANMEARAAAIGARLTIDRAGPGAVVRLLLPASANEGPQ